MNKKVVICYLLLISSLSVMARSRKVMKLRKTSLYRSLEAEPAITTTEQEQEQEVDLPKLPNKTKMILIKPRSNGEEDEGRFLKHILLYKAFMQPKISSPINRMPYLIINAPINLNNTNNNTLANQPPATTTTGTGTGTGAGTGGGAAAGGGGAGVRIAYIRDSQALPYALPMPMSTPVYQQRQQPLPQIVYGVPLNDLNKKQNNRRRNRFGNNGNTNKGWTNPFSSLGNSLRRIQYI